MEKLHYVIRIVTQSSSVQRSWEFTSLNEYSSKIQSDVQRVFEQHEDSLITLVEFPDQSQHSFGKVPTADQIIDEGVNIYVYSGNPYIMVTTNYGTFMYSMEYDSTHSNDENLRNWVSTHTDILEGITEVAMYFMGNRLARVCDFSDWKENKSDRGHTAYLDSLRAALANHAQTMMRSSASVTMFLRMSVGITAQWLSFIFTKRMITMHNLAKDDELSTKVLDAYRNALSVSAGDKNIKTFLTCIYSDESLCNQLLDELRPIDYTCCYSVISKFTEEVRNRLN